MAFNEGSFRQALADADVAGGVVSLANPEGAALIIQSGGVVIDVTTPATGACTVDAGIAADGSTSADNLIDGLDVGTAAITADNVQNAGTNGGIIRWESDEYLTVSVASGAAADLAGYLYLNYRRA
jgi:hypothetical protein